MFSRAPTLRDPDADRGATRIPAPVARKSVHFTGSERSDKPKSRSASRSNSNSPPSKSAPTSANQSASNSPPSRPQTAAAPKSVSPPTRTPPSAFSRHSVGSVPHVVPAVVHTKEVQTKKALEAEVKRLQDVLDQFKEKNEKLQESHQILAQTLDLTRTQIQLNLVQARGQMQQLALAQGESLPAFPHPLHQPVAVRPMTAPAARARAAVGAEQGEMERNLSFQGKLQRLRQRLSQSNQQLEANLNFARSIAGNFRLTASGAAAMAATGAAADRSPPPQPAAPPPAPASPPGPGTTAAAAAAAPPRTPLPLQPPPRLPPGPGLGLSPSAPRRIVEIANNAASILRAMPHTAAALAARLPVATVAASIGKPADAPSAPAPAPVSRIPVRRPEAPRSPPQPAPAQAAPRRPPRRRRPLRRLRRAGPAGGAGE
eukprot:tig00001310_g8155.t1